MLDIKFIRENKEKVRQAVINKKLHLNLERLFDLDDKRKTLQQEIDELRKKRNEISEKMKDGKPDEKLISQGKEVKKLLNELEERYKNIKKECATLMYYVPQIPSDDTPVGKDEKDNKIIEQKGVIKKFDFKTRDHIELGKILDIIDLERGVKVGGYRGYYLKNEGVLLALGIMMYALEKMQSKGFSLMIPPTLVKEFTLLGSGYFEGSEYNSQIDNIFRIASDKKDADGKVSQDHMFLVGTAEPSLLAYHAGEILEKKNLPLKLCGFSQCYRSEIGSYGKDTKGMYRVHEFMKVEQVVIMEADEKESDKVQQEMINTTKEIYDDFNFTYRLLLMCTGEQSAGKYKYFDLEVWTPGLGRWAETASASNFLDWQARRLNIKYKDTDGTFKYVYMLNNTVLPTPRILISILENNQQKDGSVKVPKVLQKWVGKEVLTPKEK
jgi:seryl-tRNA synthetase